MGTTIELEFGRCVMFSPRRLFAVVLPAAGAFFPSDTASFHQGFG
jgi:hypothetical protein